MSRREESRERGAALFVVMIAIMVAAGLAFAIVVVAQGRSGATEARRAMEASLALAEAGLDRGVAESNKPANRNNPAWPAVGGTKLASSPNNQIKDVDGNIIGTVALFFLKGDDAQAEFDQFGAVLDNNGNGTPHNPTGVGGAASTTDLEEANYVIIVSTATAAGSTGATNAVRLRATIMKNISQFNVASAVFIDDPSPDVELKPGAAWTMSGDDHDMFTGAVTATGVLPAIATSGSFNAADIADMVLNSRAPWMDRREPGAFDLVGGAWASLGMGGSGHGLFGYRFPPVFATGKGGPSGPPAPAPGPGPIPTGTGQLSGTSPTYQNNSPVTYDMAAFIDWAIENADTTYAGGVNPGGPEGTPPGPAVSNPGDFKVTYYSGNTKLSGGSDDGAGIMVVNGDLDLSGSFTFTGIVIVTGKVNVTGGGGTTILKGALISGGAASMDLWLNGTIDMHYSSGAVSSAASAAAKYVIVSWEQIAAN